MFGIIMSAIEYTYLGIPFTSNGSLKAAVTSLKAKAAKATYKLQSILYNYGNTCTKLSLKLFDSLIKPILTYACPVWGPATIKCNSSTVNFSRCDKDPIEKLCNSFYKHLLGLKKHAPNTVARAELGRYPTTIYVLKQSAKYWFKLQQTQDKLSHKALQANKAIQGKTWSSCMNNLLQDITANTDLTKTTPEQIGNTTEAALREQYIEHIHSILTQAMTTDSHLSFYGKIVCEDEYGIQPYLLLNLPKHFIKPITYLRTGCHNLPIAKGRIAKPPVPTNERHCPHCPDEMGDEFHLLFQCKFLDIALRKDCFEYAKHIQEPYNNTIHETNTPASFIKTLLSPNTYPWATCLGSFIKKSLSKMA